MVAHPFPVHRDSQKAELEMLLRLRKAAGSSPASVEFFGFFF